ncbi:MAG TPA: hypothetical protein VFI61_02280 [Patescibacteria group bacterium]|nr:hypothetical protein [Patescibacteria group bacterium]
MSNGPVLELGSGVFSTPLLHWLCLDTKRKLVTYENYKDHYDMNKVFESQTHEVNFINNWDEAKIEGTHWSVAFVDHEPRERRVTEIARLAQICDYIVIHDSEPDHDKYFGYIENAYPLFKYRYNYKRKRPYTTVLSNFVDITHI